MKPFAIKDKVIWIGALHPDLRVFDIIMQTKNGTTYNSYLIQAEKPTIIDTVKSKYSQTYLDQLSELVDLQNLTYIVVQHNEPDHSGSLQALLDKAPQATVLCTKVAAKYVQNIVNTEVKIQTVENGQEIDLGGQTLRFISAPFLHWPDTMMTYWLQGKVLFSCDVFANHFCDSHMYNDLITRDFWPDYKYYFDIIFRPFKKHVRNALKKIDELQIEMIAPSHGPILRTDIAEFINRYRRWSAEIPVNNPKRLLIYYISAHGNTATMAEEIAKGARESGIEVQLYDIGEINIHEHLDRIETCDGMLVGSPTINNDAVKPAWDLLSSLATLDVKGKISGSFGSMGWSGEATKFLDQRLTDLKFKVPEAGVTATLVPNPDELAACREFGKKIAAAL